MSLEALLHDPETHVVPLTLPQYERLVQAGDFDDQHVELLEGVVVEMAPQGWEHADLATDLGSELAVLLASRFGSRYRVGQNRPLAAPPTSRPEPDVIVVDRERWPHGTPVTGSPLVVEIAVTSQRRDLVHKPRVYARAGVELYWVVDLREREVVVHRYPVDDHYTDVTRHGFDDELEVLGLRPRISDVLE